MDKGKRFGAAVFCMMLVCMASWAAAEEQSLEQASNDPTASLLSVALTNQYSGDYHRLNGASGNVLQLRFTYPFQAFGLNNIFRATVPMVTESPSGKNGLSDVTVFDLVTFNEPWGRWGVGLVGLLPVATDEALGAEQFAIGPAAGFVARQSKLLYGVFSQNVFSVAGDDDREEVNASIVQPILNYSLPAKWSVGLSEMNLTYDWEKNDWTSLPLGLKVGKLVKISGHPVTFTFTGEYDFQDDYVGPEWTVNLTVKFLFPL
ncbi:hypothetical protein [Desulfosarcina ovata]|uniref:Transporter n=1 Tax=Desulfosarcina ovata subsp. ovata TaxID=2752305 RepID=A0A5K8ADW2_9BACT|nr:hypothetical protein [Desulfosarcina ovata]BBO90726.1 hypothetical protein DSCOOX_39060 [Desulfosarcina ovata subsp. ovata]